MKDILEEAKSLANDKLRLFNEEARWIVRKLIEEVERLRSDIRCLEMNPNDVPQPKLVKGKYNNGVVAAVLPDVPQRKLIKGITMTELESEIAKVNSEIAKSNKDIFRLMLSEIDKLNKDILRLIFNEKELCEKLAASEKKVEELEKRYENRI